MDRSRTSHWQRPVIALLLFGTAFGYLEAAVVSYLRFLHEPVRQQFYPGRSAGDLFPLLTPEQVQAADPEQRTIFNIEVGREAATMVMLAAIALAVARRAGQWAAAFVVAFGVWDIVFYASLRLLLGWPSSLFTWDILFLIPVPWVGPVLAPVIVSAAMIAGGIFHLRRDAIGSPVHVRAAHGCGMVLGAVVIVVSFAMDYRNVSAGGMPRPFHWWIFGSGMALGVLSFVQAAMPAGAQRELSVAESAGGRRHR